MAYEFIGEHGSVVDNFYNINGKGRDFSEHYSPQRVGGFEVEVLDDELGALVVGLHMTVLALCHPLLLTKRAVYLQEAHVDCAALGIVVHRGQVLTRRLGGAEGSGGGRVSTRLRLVVESDV